MDVSKLYDTIIVGGGPAGLTAAIYLARARYRVLVIEKEHWGGQITITADVVNYPGVERTSGTDLTDHMRAQAQHFGAEFLFAEVSGLKVEGEIKTVVTARGEFQCFGILLATGAHPRPVGFTGEEEYKGRGVAYCATCDGEFFTGKDVFVVGGGFAAAEESVFLTKYARNVTILIREDDFTCAKSAADEARSHKGIRVLTNIEVEEVGGGRALTYLRYRSNKTGEVTEYQATEDEDFGVFVFAGYAPATDLVRGIADLNEHGYIITDSNQRTSVDGLYAAGDVCIKSLRQVVTAVGDGALAATELERYAAKMQKQTGYHPVPPANAKTAEPEPQPQLSSAASDHRLFGSEMQSQLQPLFDRMERPMILQLSLDNTDLSAELQEYMEGLVSMTGKLTLEMNPASDDDSERPCVRVLTSDRKATGLAFHGVPGGHEFTSFMLGIYNASGPGQALDPNLLRQIHGISKPVDIKILVSLSCTMCPDLVTAAQSIAARNEMVTAEVYDLSHFPDLQKQYQVMSVPCMVINEEHVTFGKKNTEQILQLIENL